MTPGNWKSPGMPIPRPPKLYLDYRVTWTPDGQGLQEQRPDRLVRLPHHRYSGTRLPAWTPAQPTRSGSATRYDDNRKVGLERRRNRTGRCVRCAHELRSHRAADHHGDRRGRGRHSPRQPPPSPTATGSQAWRSATSGCAAPTTPITTLQTPPLRPTRVTNADIDTAIKVRVNFTDDDGYSETLTSNATASVPVPAPVIVPPEAPQIAQAAVDADVTFVQQHLGPHPQRAERRRVLIVGSSSGNQVFTTRNSSSSSIGDIRGRSYRTAVDCRSMTVYINYDSQFKVVGSDAARVSIYEARDNIW